MAERVIVDERASQTRSRHRAIWRDATEARERPRMRWNGREGGRVCRIEKDETEAGGRQDKKIEPD